MDGINLAVYLSRRGVDAPTAMALGRALLGAGAAGASEAVAEALEGVSAAHAAVVAAHKRRRVLGADDVRPLHLALCAYWSAFVGRVDHFCVLPPEADPNVAKAERLLALLAPDGNAALSLAHPACWATLRARLSRVDDEGLRGAMVEIAGAPFLAVTEAALDDFGRALGLTAAPAATSEDELLREFTQAVSDYALQVAASVRRNRPETIRAAQAALRPLEELRAMARRGDAEGVDEDDDLAKHKGPEKIDGAGEAPAAAPSPARASAQPMGTPSVAPPN